MQFSVNLVLNQYQKCHYYQHGHSNRHFFSKTFTDFQACHHYYGAAIKLYDYFAFFCFVFVHTHLFIHLYICMYVLQRKHLNMHAFFNAKINGTKLLFLVQILITQLTKQNAMFFLEIINHCVLRSIIYAYMYIYMQFIIYEHFEFTFIFTDLFDFLHSRRFGN